MYKTTVASDTAGIPIACGSIIKIMHDHAVDFELNSEPKQLNGGSGQQIVTWVNAPSTHNTLWWVRPAHHGSNSPGAGSTPGGSKSNKGGDTEQDSRRGEYVAGNIPTPHAEGATPPLISCQLAEPIRCGTTIRLTHLLTRNNLHSHNVPSILSKQQEVTAFGQGDGQGDGGDNWRVECTSSTWRVDEPFRLFHIDTGKYLGAAPNVQFNQQTCGSQCPLMNHLEAFGRASVDKYTLLRVQQGIHIHT
jgi:hypothetical protein